MKKRIVIKLGTGVLSTPAGKSLDTDQFTRLAAEIATLQKEGHSCILVSSAAIAAGVRVLKLKQRPDDLSGKQACAAAGQPELMRLYATSFKKHGFAVAQLLLTHGDIDSFMRRDNARNTLNCLLERGAIPIINENDVVIAISQSGETADTLAALELAKSKGATILGICNVVGSSISRITDAGSYTHAGPEIGVASTKAFTAQVTILTLMALQLANKKGTISQSRFHELLSELEAIPEKVRQILAKNDHIESIAKAYKDASNALYLGRGSSFPVALEGALKLKEISYIHAEGYPAAEMKHGPIALIDENMPVVVVAPNNGHYEKLVSNVQEVKAREGKVIAIVTEGDTEIINSADHVIEIPETLEALTPLLTVIPLQLLSYYIAVMRGCDVDRPRNLAKSVTVE